MKAKHLLILFVLAAGMAVLAYVTSRRPEAVTPDRVGRRVFPELPVNEIRRLCVTSPGSTATVARVGDRWVCFERFNYPADFVKVKEALLALADLKVGQVVRIEPERRDELGLLPPPGPAGDGADARGTRVEVFAEDGHVVASLLLGKEHVRQPDGAPAGFRGSPDGRYVSTGPGGDVYRISDALQVFSDRPTDWIDAELLNVPGADVRRITITGPDREPVNLIRGEDGSLRLAGLAGDEEADSSKLYGVESALSYLRFTDVVDPATTDEELGMAQPTVFQATTTQDVQYTVWIGGSPEASDDRSIRIGVALAAAAPPAGATDAEQPGAAEEGETGEDKGVDPEEILRLNDQLSKWTYAIPSYKAEALTRSRADLLKKKAEEEETDGETEETAEPTPKRRRFNWFGLGGSDKPEEEIRAEEK